MQERDLAATVRLHQEGFPGYFLTSLGPAFLKRYYRMFTRGGGHVGLVAEREGRALGFVVGTIRADPYLELVKREWYALPFVAPRLVGRVLGRPGWTVRILRKLAGLERVAKEAESRGGRMIDLYSITVEPEARGTGVGRTLLDAFVHEARALGATQVLLGAKKSETAVIRFYANAGFVPFRETLDARGDATIELVLDIARGEAGKGS